MEKSPNLHSGWRKLYVDICFKKMLKSPLKKTLEWRKISVEMFLRKTEHFWETCEWRNLHSEWRFLHSERRKLSVEFFFQKKSSKHVWKKWMEKLSVEFVFQKKSSKRFWKTFEWRNLHSEWRFLHFNFLNGENSLLRFFSKKVPNASEKHLNGEISIQNGDFFILNGENSLLSFFLSSKRFWKKNKWRKSPFRMEISPFWMEKIISGVCFSKKKFKTLLKKMNGEISILNGENSL